MKRTPLLLMLLLVLLLASACGGTGAPAATQPPPPTVIPTFQYQSPTPRPARPTSAVTPTAADSAGSADAQAIERGRGRFADLGCAACHGANAEGGEAKALAGTTMSEDDFLTFLRSGGGLGGSHQYASNRISNSGVHNIYLYLESLGS